MAFLRDMSDKAAAEVQVCCNFGGARGSPEFLLSRHLGVAITPDVGIVNEPIMWIHQTDLVCIKNVRTATCSKRMPRQIKGYVPEKYLIRVLRRAVFFSP